MVYVVLLLLDFIPDGIDGFGAPLDVEIQARFQELAAHRLDELGDIGVATVFPLVELAGDVGVGFPVGIFQRHILQFRLDGVKPQPVGQGSIQIVGFHGDVSHQALVGMVVDGLHQHQAVHDHDYDDADIIGEGHQQATEVFRFGDAASRI